ncbi:uncharacterized protein LOC113554700 [Rhopalosiphum maidis]|uniref:uncharacterized protein LOC113554700 n=1 Tax=Rhopalosiphum maidis TaxID=43146 RepID=UPI000EFFFAD0|nr:uncharacterized protein LOC113554700 [Rhopalosiphum maidis]
MFYFALLLQSEIQNGYLMRNMIAGVTIFEILLSFLTIQVIFSIVQAFFLFFLADFLLYISWESSLLLIIQLNIAIGTCGMSIGLFIGSFANSSIKSFYVTLLVCFLNIMSFLAIKEYRISSIAYFNYITIIFANSSSSSYIDPRTSI